MFCNTLHQIGHIRSWVNFIKLFFVITHEQAKFFVPSLMFVDKVRLTRDKHSSLLGQYVSYKVKSFVRLVSG